MHKKTIFILLILFPLCSFSDDTLVDKIVKEASAHVGEKYVWGGNILGKGVDCSSFVQLLYKKHGYNLPRRAVWQVVHTKSCPTYYDFSDLMIGDTVYFQKKTSKEIDHVALISGFTKNNIPIMIHAKSTKDGIVKEVMSKRYANRAVAIKRFSECTSPLGKGYKNSEVASAILYFAKKYKIAKLDIYEYLIKKSNMRPNLIRVRVYDKDIAKQLIKYLKSIRDIKATYDTYSGEVVFEVHDIKKTVQILKELKVNKYIFFIGIGGIDGRKVTLADMKTILYPYINIGKLLESSSLPKD